MFSINLETKSSFDKFCYKNSNHSNKNILTNKKYYLFGFKIIIRYNHF